MAQRRGSRPPPARPAQASSIPAASRAPTKAGTAAAHGAPLGAAEIEGARKRLGWPYPPFEVPEAIRARWRAVGARGAETSRAWRERLVQAPADLRHEFERRQSGELPA